MPNPTLTRSRMFLGFFLFTVSISFCQTISSIDKRSLESIIAHRDGKILLLNIWATWCEPCKEEFPDLVKLSSQMNKNEVEVIAISVDDPEDSTSKIHPFLKSQNVPFKVYLSDFPSQDTLIDFINKDWSGGIPATVIYDRHGNRKAFLFGLHSFEQFKKAVEDVLRKQ